MKTAALLFAAGAAPTLASIAFSAPVASSNLVGGTPFTVKWRDDGTVPSLATFGLATIHCCVGGTVQQACLADLATVDVDKASSVSITIPATIGPNAVGTYFLRADSTVLDPNSTFGANYQAFSAKFDLTGMSGVFNATTSPIASAGSTAANVTAPVSAVTSAVPTTSAVVPASASVRPTITSTLLSTSSGVATQNGSAASVAKSVPIVGVSFAALFAALLA